MDSENAKRGVSPELLDLSLGVLLNAVVLEYIYFFSYDSE